MAEVDTSSYLKPSAGKSSIEVANELATLKQRGQSIERQGIGIEADKLSLINSRFQTLAKQLVPLVQKSDLSEGDVTGEYDKAVKLGLMDADSAAKAKSLLPPKATSAQLREHIEGEINRGRTMMEAINYHYGTPVTVDTGQTITPAVESVKPGFGVRQIGPTIQKQPVPTTPIEGLGGTQQLGPQPYQPPSGPGPLPTGPISNPAIQGQSGNFGGNVIGATVEPNAPASPRLPVQKPMVPAGPVTSLPPLYAEGKAAYVADQDLATQKLTAIKPALQALPLLKGLTSGPGTGKWNEAVAGLSNLGIIPQGLTDKTAIYQEVTKKLAQYVSSNPVGQRSDAAQTLAEASSPSPKTQISPALIKLTKDAIMLDRVQAARAGAFTKVTGKDKEGNEIHIPENDYSKYVVHRGEFPQRVDERAFGLDLMDPEERNTLLKEMDQKLTSKDSKEKFEAEKFKKSLKIVKRLDLYSQ